MSKAVKKERKPSTRDMSLNDLAPYIKGDKFLDIEFNEETATNNDFQSLWNQLQMDMTYRNILDTCEYHGDFFSMCQDLGNMYDKNKQKDLFYGAKLGYFYEGVPMVLVYSIRECLKEYPCGNLVMKRISVPLLNRAFSRGGLNNATLYSIISDLLGYQYSVVDNNHLIAHYNDFSEVYIPKEDMVAIVPNDLAEALTPDYIESLELYEDGLASPDGVKLGCLAGYHGACNSFYDLRNLV